MQRVGFIHDMMDVKVLILFVTARVNEPLTSQEIYELCYQDDCLSYFDVCTAIPQMVESGHLQAEPEEKYQITEKGRSSGELTEDSLAFTVRQKAEDAVDRFNRQLRRRSFVDVKLRAGEGTQQQVSMTLSDEMGQLMRLELTAPNQRQALRLSRLLEQKAEAIYNLTMEELLSEEKEA